MIDNREPTKVDVSHLSRIVWAGKGALAAVLKYLIEISLSFAKSSENLSECSEYH